MLFLQLYNQKHAFGPYLQHSHRLLHLHRVQLQQHSLHRANEVSRARVRLISFARVPATTTTTHHQQQQQQQQHSRAGNSFPSTPRRRRRSTDRPRPSELSGASERRPRREAPSLHHSPFGTRSEWLPFCAWFFLPRIRLARTVVLCVVHRVCMREE